LFQCKSNSYLKIIDIEDSCCGGHWPRRQAHRGTGGEEGKEAKKLKVWVQREDRMREK
jgi:hypothetical protein